MPIPVFRPSCSQAEIDAVTRVLKSGWWGAGPETAAFEKEFAEFIGTKHALAMNSCTAALHLAGSILNLPKGSEVITTPITFVSTAYLASYNNLTPVFADIDEETLNIDPASVEKHITKNTRIILPVHYGGHAVDLDPLLKLRQQHNLTLIEDCAHATGATYKSKPLGSFGDISVFSFQAVKNLATGDGGMLLTNNDELARKARILRWCGINTDTSQRTGRDQYSWEYAITDVGYKFQMPDLLAAIGRVQLQRLKQLNARRREITTRYNEAFAKLDWLQTPIQKSYAGSSNHNYCIRARKLEGGKRIPVRDKLITYLGEKGISASVHYKPLYLHDVYVKQGIKADCPVADRVWKELLLLPIYPDMTEDELNQVITSVKSFNV